MNKFLLIFISAAIFSGCSLVPSAWKSVRSNPPAGGTPTALPAEASAEAGGPTQTVEQLDAAVTADLETSMDADLNQIDQDLKAIDEEAKNY